MTVREFLARAESRRGEALPTVMDLIQLLDEFDQEKCCTLVGKIRAQMRINTGKRRGKGG